MYLVYSQYTHSLLCHKYQLGLMEPGSALRFTCRTLKSQ